MSIKHKKFGIEKRYVNGIVANIFGDNWTLYKWYKTEKDRDKAFIDLEKNRNHGIRLPYTKEYRKIDR